MKRFFLFSSCLLCALLMFVAACGLSAQSHQPPNIVLILTDDLGWSCFSTAMDDRVPASKSDYYETPNIDRFMQRGMRFSKGYAPDPICSPSRRSIQFGQTSIRQGDTTFAERYASGQHRAIPGEIKARDPRYRTAHFGKWDLRAGLSPAQVGYDESDGDNGNGAGNFSKDKEDKWAQQYLLDNPKQMDYLTQRSLQFIQTQVTGNHPFYLQVSHYATHLNFETRPATFEKFKTKKEGEKHGNPAWAGMIYDLDASIGTLLKAIDSLGIADNTYIFLMADNGAVEFLPPVSNRLDPPSAFASPMRNAPLRGGKWTLYEGGIRVPFVVAGPGIRPGSQSDVPVAGWDLLPTFSELAGNSAPPPGDLDGGSIVSLLRNAGMGLVRRPSDAFFFHRFHKGYPHSAVISGDYKLIKFWKNGTAELYNLQEDPGEQHDIASRDPQKAGELESRLLRYLHLHNLP